MIGKHILGFDFFDNLVYSKHLLFSDLFGLKGLNDQWYQELKIERAAVEKPQVTIVYSDFMRKRIFKSLSNKSHVVVLPLGIDLKEYECEKKQNTGLVISYFGRFEDVQKGFYEYVKCVQNLEKSFIEKHNLVFNIYGKGALPQFIKKQCFNEITFLDGKDKTEAYGSTDIVIMPSRYEPFGYVGLEALASGCALLVTKGLGMDEFLNEDNHIPIEADATSIAAEIRELVENREKLSKLQRNGPKSISQWTNSRSVQAHLRVFSWYKEIDFEERRKLFNLTSWNQIDSIKLVNPNAQKVAYSLLKDKSVSHNDESSLLLGNLIIKTDNLNIHAQRKIGERTDDFMLGRLEFLPWSNESFDKVLLMGGLEISINPQRALIEALRVSKTTLICVHFTTKLFVGQTLQAESIDEWLDFHKKIVKGKKRHIKRFENYIIIEYLI
jgi:hypothetical protein